MTVTLTKINRAVMLQCNLDIPVGFTVIYVTYVSCVQSNPVYPTTAN